jgi:hypothetical protein
VHSRALAQESVHSALIATLWAAAHPDRASALILADAFVAYALTPETPWMPTPEEWEDRIETMYARWTGSAWSEEPWIGEREQAWFRRYIRASIAPGAYVAEVRRYLDTAVISLEPNGRPNAYSDKPPHDQLALVRICTHYFSHAAWLEEGELLRQAPLLTGIPGAIIHGRLDLGSPVATAWELVHAWPGAGLVVVRDSGHTGSDGCGRRQSPRRSASSSHRRSRTALLEGHSRTLAQTAVLVHDWPFGFLHPRVARSARGRASVACRPDDPAARIDGGERRRGLRPHGQRSYTCSDVGDDALTGQTVSTGGG